MDHVLEPVTAVEWLADAMSHGLPLRAAEGLLENAERLALAGVHAWLLARAAEHQARARKMDREQWGDGSYEQMIEEYDSASALEATAEAFAERFMKQA